MTGTHRDEAEHATILGLLRFQPGRVVLAVVLAGVAALLSLVQPWVAGRVVDAVGSGRPIAVLLVVLIVIVLGQVAAEAVGNYVQETMGEAGARHVRQVLGGALLEAEFTGLAAHRSGDVIARFTTDVEALRDGISRGWIQVVTAAVTAVVAGTLLFLLDPVLLGVIVLVLVLAAAGAWVFLQRIETTSRAKQEALGDVASLVGRLLAGLRTIRLFGVQRPERKRLETAVDASCSAGRRLALWVSAVTPAIELAATGSFLALLLVGGSRVAMGEMAVGDLVTALMYSTIVVVPLGMVVDAVIALSTASGALVRINEILALSREDACAPGAAPRENGEGVPTYGLEASDLTFGFAGGPAVLRDVNLRIRKGTSVLVKGASGSGKSTLVNLICRFHGPYTGTIRLDGVDISRLTPCEVRERIALVEQDAPVLFGTVRESLVHGRPEATDTELEGALASVALLDRLGGPGVALERELGEQGTGLSGGERQRLAVARALLSRRPLIILDEPTASLDAESRDRVIAALRGREPGQTVLIISHDDRDRAWTDHQVDLPAPDPRSE